MHPNRLLPPKGAYDLDVQREGGQPFGAAEDVGTVGTWRAMLDRCLTALGGRYPVVVVDDASHAPGRVAAMCAAHGARLVRRERNGGPGAARNDALADVGTEFVALKLVGVK